MRAYRYKWHYDAVDSHSREATERELLGEAQLEEGGTP